MKTSFLHLFSLCIISQAVAMPNPVLAGVLVSRNSPVSDGETETVVDGTQIAEGWKRDEETTDGTQIAEGWKRDEEVTDGTQIAEGW